MMHSLTAFLPGRVFGPVLGDLVAPGFLGIPIEWLVIAGLAVLVISIVTAVILIVLDRKKRKK
ncbi:MAG: hypothetical protein J6Z38_04305 [Lachnospiraceae bacterium]|nr:hypothetical protein [Lachnospiraceae bacterium]